MPFPPTLADFGHGTMTQNGRAAAGTRPLLVVLVEYSDFPPFSDTHPAGYYEALAFGNPSPPFSTDGPVNPASLVEYFRENSHGRFTFGRLAVVGPLQMGVLNDPGPEARTAIILSQVGAQSPGLFVGIDDNDNRQVEFDELCVLLFENIPGAQPANRDNNPVVIQVPFGGAMVNVTMRVHFAGAGPLTPFYQIAHEVSHSLGTIDLYNVGSGNQALTLMSRYPFFSNDQVSVHLDAWHKLLLGWIEPRRLALTTAGSATIGHGPQGALLLWDETRRQSEYFLVEHRRRAAPGVRYDDGVAGDGACVWRVQPAMGLAAHLGAPGLAVGGSGVWGPGTQTPLLRWSDGSSTTRTLTFTTAPNGEMLVAWGDELSHASTTRHLRLFHGGNGISAVDSGLPMQGVFFGVTSEGNLEWNRYNGRGEQVGDPQSVQSWAPNTGNLIGRGFGHLSNVFACGDGVVMAVHPNGDLYWFRYDGNGESDVTGALGWAANSGNVIGRGWAGFLRIFVMPQAGPTSSRMKIFAVATNGDLHWYSYSGNGEQDPTGTLGWHPNSGNIVGNGWDGFRHVHGSANMVFAVAQDGRLLWYSYAGQGEEDPSGAAGWHANSGNAIGRGWDGMQHVFGGVTDLGGFGHTVFGVTQPGDLHWYHYTGHGEADETGVLGWHPRSGAKIGTGW
jgi:M6 family metalloprotease-like protein